MDPETVDAAYTALQQQGQQTAQQVPPQQYAAQPAYPQAGFGPGMGGGGMLQRFLGGGFGRAIATGAGFGIGDELIQSIF